MKKNIAQEQKWARWTWNSKATQTEGVQELETEVIEVIKTLDWTHSLRDSNANFFLSHNEYIQWNFAVLLVVHPYNTYHLT